MSDDDNEESLFLSIDDGSVKHSRKDPEACEVQEELKDVGQPIGATHRGNYKRCTQLMM